MSFGFGVGDFLAVLKLAKRVQKDFVGAPGQFQEISAHAKSVSSILEEIDDDIKRHELSDEEKNKLEDATISCRSVLEDLEEVARKYSELESKQRDAGEAIKRVWRRLKWDSGEVADLRSRVISSIILLDSFRQIRARSLERRRVALDWLTTIDYSTQQADFISRRQPGTGLWLLDSSEYRSWVETKKETLFCPGIPGAGKTTLTSIVIDDLINKFGDDPTICIAYIYLNFRRQAEQTATDLSLSLLRQLAEGRPSLPNSVKDLYDKHQHTRTHPSRDEIARTLGSVASIYSRVFIVVDALDECQTSDGCRNAFLSEVFDLQEKRGVNILATSRFIPEIMNKFARNISLEIRASTEDVKKYLEGRIERLPYYIRDKPKIQEQIVAVISGAADGMFLLAQLYFSSLEDKPTVKAVKKALDSFQRREGQATEEKKVKILEDAYGIVMERINEQKQDYKDLATRVLSWVTSARWPLKVIELQYALAVEPGDEELDEDNIPDIGLIVAVCAGLVTIDERSDILRLVHYTTQEYLEKEQERWLPEAQLNVTRDCIAYLSLRSLADGLHTSERLRQRFARNRFYLYAAQNWGYHARKSKYASVCPEVINFLRSSDQAQAAWHVLFERTSIRSLIPSLNKGRVLSWPRKGSGLHLAAYFGLVETVGCLIEEGCDLEAKDGDGKTPLRWAVERKHKKVLLALLDKGANIETQDRCLERPLHHAVSRCDYSMTRLLLEKGANIKARNRDGETAIQMVLKKKTGGNELKSRLSISDLYISDDEAIPESSLVNGTITKDKAIFELLLENGATLEDEML